MAAADDDARSFKKALAQRGTCIDGSWCRPCPASAAGPAGCGRAPGSGISHRPRAPGWRRRIDVQADDVLELGGERGIVRPLEAADAVRLQVVRRPDPLHRAQRCPLPRPWRGRSSGSPRRAASARSARPPAGPWLAPAAACRAGGSRRAAGRRRRPREALLPAPHRRPADAGRRMISAVPQPSAVDSMIRARQTCFCARLRSATIASSRARSAALTSISIPLRMTHKGQDCPMRQHLLVLLDLIH